MIKNVLSDIGGIGVYGIISIGLFFIVFIGAVARTCFLRKSHVVHASRLPLNDGFTDEHPVPLASMPNSRK